MTQVGPEVQSTSGRTGAVTGPLVGAGKYTEGSDHEAPSHDTDTPEPVISVDAWPPVPPPSAMQNVSEMHDREEKPPPGGRVVRGEVQPGTVEAGRGTVVGTPDGGAVVVVVVLEWSDAVGPVEGASRAEALADPVVDAADPPEQPQPAAARTARDTDRISLRFAT